MERQNQNEALNAIFWVRVQKSVFVDPEILQLGIYDAVAHCNIRYQASVKVLEELGISLCHYCKDEAQQADSVWVLKASCKEWEVNKSQQRLLPCKKKIDKQQEKEGDTYVPGGLWWVKWR